MFQCSKKYTANSFSLLLLNKKECAFLDQIADLNKNIM